MAKQKTERQVDFVNRFGSPTQWLLGLGIGLGSGYVTLNNLVQQKFHEYMLDVVKIREQFIAKSEDNDLTKIHNKALKGGEEIEQGTSEGRQFAKRLARAVHNGKADLRAFEDDYVGTTMKMANGPIGRRSPLGLWQRLGFVSRESQWLIGFKTLFAFGAATGVTLMAFNQLNTRDKLNDITKSDMDMNAKLDKLIERQVAIGHTIQKDQPLFGNDPLETEKTSDGKLKHGGHARTIEAQREAEQASEAART